MHGSHERIRNCDFKILIFKSKDAVSDMLAEDYLRCMQLVWIGDTFKDCPEGRKGVTDGSVPRWRLFQRFHK